MRLSGVRYGLTGQRGPGVYLALFGAGSGAGSSARLLCGEVRELAPGSSRLTLPSGTLAAVRTAGASWAPIMPG